MHTQGRVEKLTCETSPQTLVSVLGVLFLFFEFRLPSLRTHQMGKAEVLRTDQIFLYREHVRMSKVYVVLKTRPTEIMISVCSSSRNHKIKTTIVIETIYHNDFTATDRVL